MQDADHWRVSHGQKQEPKNRLLLVSQSGLPIRHGAEGTSRSDVRCALASHFGPMRKPFPSSSKLPSKSGPEGRAMPRRRRGRWAPGWSHRSVAKDIGISPATLTRAEGGRLPDLATFQKICTWLKINPAQFLDIPVEAGEPDAPSELPTPVAAVHLKASKTLPRGAATGPPSSPIAR